MTRVTADELAQRMPDHWGLPDAPKLLGLGGGVSACLLNAVPGEVSAAATDNHILSFVVRGERHHRQWHDGRQRLDGYLPSNSINIVPAGCAPRAIISEPIRVLHVYLPQKTLVDLAASIQVCGSTETLEIIDPRYAPDERLTSLLSALHDTVDNRTPVDRLWCDSLCNAIAARVLQRWSSLAPTTVPGGPAGGLAGWQLRRVVDLLRAGLAEDRSLGDLAATVGLSSFHFARAFKASTGVPPRRYLIQLRMERARELVGTTDLPVTEVAAQVGYDDPGHLAKLFRKHFGTTPAGYRRERRS